MRYIQFAQQFAQQFSKIIIVVDMRQELPVAGRQHFPVYSVHVHLVETFLFLLANMVEHVFPFGRPVHLQHCLIRYRLQGVRTGVHLL